ncbi:MAG: PH domain-containing protein [Patescibacteria group bacterium]|jgi:uncharacterized membrane protein YdbT with pleckstrin-like domain
MNTFRRNIVTGRPSELFPGQLQDEEVLIFIRRHWMAFAPWMLILGFMVLIPLVVGYLIFRFQILDLSNSTVFIVLLLIGSMHLLITNAVFITAWIEHYLDVGVLTSERLIIIEQVGLFSRKVVELPLARVQDVTAHMRGYVQTLLRYGTVVVESASDAPSFTLKNVPRPYVVANTILLLHDKLAARPNGTQAMAQHAAQRIDEQGMRSMAQPTGYRHEHLREHLLVSPPPPTAAPSSVQPKPSPNRLPQTSRIVANTGELEEGQIIEL